MDYGAYSPVGGVIPSFGDMNGFDLSKLLNWKANSMATPATAASITPPANLGGNLGPATGLGFNIGTGQLALGGLQTLGNLWTAWNATNLANKQFDFQKDVTNTNLNNSIKSYNTNLEDKINSRFFTEGKSMAAALDFINAHKLTR